jgi:hypothetical protein
MIQEDELTDIEKLQLQYQSPINYIMDSLDNNNNQIIQYLMEQNKYD